MQANILLRWLILGVRPQSFVFGTRDVREVKWLNRSVISKTSAGVAFLHFMCKLQDTNDYRLIYNTRQKNQIQSIRIQTPYASSLTYYTPITLKFNILNKFVIILLKFSNSWGFIVFPSVIMNPHFATIIEKRSVTKSSFKKILNLFPLANCLYHVKIVWYEFF